MVHVKLIRRVQGDPLPPSGRRRSNRPHSIEGPCHEESLSSLGGRNRAGAIRRSVHVRRAAGPITPERRTRLPFTARITSRFLCSGASVLARGSPAGSGTFARRHRGAVDCDRSRSSPDRELQAGFWYLFHRLQQPTGVPDVPTGVDRLLGARPNPFNPRHRHRLRARRRKRVRLVIHDLQGRRVRTVLDAVLKPGEHSIRWNGRDDHDRRQPSGVYFVRFAAETCAP